MTDSQLPWAWAIVALVSLALWTLLALAAYGVYLLAT